MMNEFYTKQKSNSELLKSLNFSEDFIQDQLEKYSISIEKIIFELLELNYKSNYRNDKQFILSEEVTRLYDYSYTDDMINDFKIFETINFSDKETYFPIILVYIDSFMFYDEIYSHSAVEDEFFDDYFLEHVKKSLDQYFEKDQLNFEGLHNFIDRIIRVFIGTADILDSMQYSEIKRSLKITVEESLGF